MSEKAKNTPPGEKGAKKKTSRTAARPLPDSKDAEQADKAKQADKAEQARQVDKAKQTDKADKAEQAKQADKAKQAMPFLKIPESAVVLVLLLVLVATAFILLNKRLLHLEDSLTVVGNTNNSVIEDLENRISDNALRFPAINTGLDELKTQQDIFSDTLPESAQLHINKDYALTEIEYLLIIADHNLQLTHNVSVALAAMQAAEARLKGLTGSKVQAVHKQLIADMDNIKSIKQLDLSGLGLYLSDLIRRVDKLPLREEATTDPVEKQTDKQAGIKETNGFKRFFILVWQELKSLVVIKRNKNMSQARLFPDETYLIRANIKFELANARFAVFNRDRDNLHAAIEHIQKYLTDYFDISDTAVANINASMERMKKIDPGFPKADISSSLESVRGLMRTEDNQIGTGQTP